MTIERAIKLLAGQWDAYGDCMSKEEYEAYKMAIDALKKCGANDVVPVVRCKDCKWGIKKTNCMGEDMVNCYNTESPVCDSCMLTSPEWFCAEGEKEK